MLSQLTAEMKTAAGAAKLPANPTANIVMGFTVTEVLKVLMDQALILGRAYRDDLEQAGKAGIDAIVEFDLPLIPDGVENTLDGASRAAGYAAIKAVLDAVLGPAGE